ncbi:hypothetical protein DBR33_00560 [Stenotrophomonas sp. HMWF022]|jgi:hypothetical protein|nr:hypothetical protein DBR20_17145 [Stenotrophomonas sp. HMWF023]PTT58627.1 hypothetical protein DBR33_00560 [Stenotrophomonas sp. HMWF022]
MEQVMPWKALLAEIEPHYPRSGCVGQPPYLIETMLRILLLQQWCPLSDTGMEEALHEIASMRGGMVGFMPDAEGSMDHRLPRRSTLAFACEGRPDQSPVSTECVGAVAFAGEGR